MHRFFVLSPQLPPLSFFCQLSLICFGSVSFLWGSVWALISSAALSLQQSGWSSVEFESRASLFKTFKWLHSSLWTLRHLPGCVRGSSPCELFSRICATLPQSLVCPCTCQVLPFVPWSLLTCWSTAWSVLLPTLGISGSCFRSSARPSVKTPWSCLFQSLGCFMAPPHRWSFVLLLLYIPSLIVGTNYFLAECMVNIMERFLTLFWEKERKILLSVIVLCKKCL